MGKALLLICFLAVSVCMARNITMLGASRWVGVSLAGAEFGSNIPGVYGKDYIFPNNQEIDYYTGKGMNVFRLPFLWERLQGSQNGPFDATYLGRIDAVVNYANSKGAYVLLDPHNYARYYGSVIGQGNVPTSSFANFWATLATHFRDNQKVVFGIMNEPHDMTTELWLQDANAAIAAIRSVGAKQLITVPGNGYTGASSWSMNWYGTPNSQVMLNVKDPANNFVFEVHQYLDQDNSGTHDSCVSATIGSQRLQDFTNWCRQHGFKAWLGEWAGARNQVCYDAVNDMMQYVAKNTDIYVGWTWWAGGPWWGDYMFALDPVNGQDRPQMTILQKYLR